MPAFSFTFSFRELYGKSKIWHDCWPIYPWLYVFDNHGSHGIMRDRISKFWGVCTISLIFNIYLSPITGIAFCCSNPHDPKTTELSSTEPSFYFQWKQHINIYSPRNKQRSKTDIMLKYISQTRMNRLPFT